MMRKLILLSTIVFFVHVAHAQRKEMFFQNYQTRNGLSSNTIYAIAQDKFGFLWLGTEDGVNRFDGTNMVVYRQHPHEENGLKSNYITSLLEDNYGNIWIGTKGGGLNYYDRNLDSVKAYSNYEENNGPSAVNALMQDSQDNIWVASYGSLFIIAPGDKEVINDGEYKKIQKYFDGQIVYALYRDRSERIWVGSSDGIYLVDKAFTVKPILECVRDDLEVSTDEAFTAFSEDSLGRMYVSSMQGLYLFESDGELRQFFGEDPQGGLISNKIYDVKYNKGNVWIATDKGLDIFDLDCNKVAHFEAERNKFNSLSSSSIRSIFFDKSGIAWVGTFQGGLNKYDPYVNTFYLNGAHPLDVSGKNSLVVTSFSSQGDNIFVGTDGDGLYRYSVLQDKLEPVPLTGGTGRFSDLNIMALCHTKPNRLWIGTYLEGLLYLDANEGRVERISVGAGQTQINHPDVFCLKEDRSGMLWIGTNGGGVNVLDPRSGKIDKFMYPKRGIAITSKSPANNYIRAIEEDQDGNIWVGTFGAGISIFDVNERRFSHLNQEADGLPSDYILAIKKDTHGNMWIGTNGHGLAVRWKGETVFERLSEGNGLLNDVVQGIVEDDMGNIWFSTNKGLSCFNKETKNFKNYTRALGLQEDGFIRGAVLALSDGHLFFGGKYGFNHFLTNRLVTNPNVPTVVLTALKVDNQLVNPNQKSSLREPILTAKEIFIEFKQNFSIVFEAISFTVPEDIQFMYRLSGVDKDWIRANKDHSASYTNLDPGEYVFEVKASNNDGVWNDKVTSIKVVVAPPYWRTGFAYILYIIFGLTILLYIRKRTLQRIQSKFKLEQERIDAKRLIEQERKGAEQLRELDRQKIKFLTNLSHEFRTPISLIVGPLEKILDDTKDRSLSGQVRMIQRNASRLLNLVNQLLDFRKLEEGEMKLALYKNEINAFVADICTSFQDLAQKKQISLSYKSSLPATQLLFDADKLERILFNLLSNAFKFTSGGGEVKVTCSGTVREKDKIDLRISVTDTGSGIRPEDRETIFESFFQSDNDEKILNQGSGIGLSIVKSYVELHGGKITVDSEVGIGSTFEFHLPLDIVYEDSKELELENEFEETQASEEPTNGSALDNLKPNILLIEDDDDFRQYLRSILEEQFNVLDAANGKEGWQKALFHHPDIIISDVHMPVMNGVELAYKLADDRRTKHIPIILLTAAQGQHEMLSGLESGAVDYIVKPFDSALLLAKISSLLHLHSAAKEIYMQQIAVQGPEVAVVNERDKFVQKVLTYIFENMSSPQLSVETLSGHLHVSRASLYNKLLSYTGMTPVDFIRSTKLEKAATLMEKTDMTIAEIAYETGFANPNYFTKVFKAKYKQTPSEYLQYCRAKQPI